MAGVLGHGGAFGIGPADLGGMKSGGKGPGDAGGDADEAGVLPVAVESGLVEELDADGEGFSGLDGGDFAEEGELDAGAFNEGIFGSAGGDCENQEEEKESHQEGRLAFRDEDGLAEADGVSGEVIQAAEGGDAGPVFFGEAEEGIAFGDAMAGVLGGDPDGFWFRLGLGFWAGFGFWLGLGFWGRFGLGFGGWAGFSGGRGCFGDWFGFFLGFW